MSSLRSFSLLEILICVWKHCCCEPIIPVDTLYAIFDCINKHHLLQPPAKFWLKQQIWQVTNHHLEVFLSWWLVDKTAQVPDYFEDLPSDSDSQAGKKVARSVGIKEHLVWDDLAETEITSILKTNKSILLVQHVCFECMFVCICECMHSKQA